ncbi:DNA polymerase III subunit gamma/tau [Hyalangium sp.]|uniref:DNA polymerase III subunit gamma/tau n=1 Tax=Hyalangium sp. TaxID=2028555 RepID=UPI002D25F830|nr:DNA polymerase III subunit gamma/tau [Hyalangium sp.]HYI01177.1 DNA polymerase III subunit gamma/tau [Hyalangium sp.]
MRLTNVRRPVGPETEAVDDDEERLFAEEGSAEGCASGECLPDAPQQESAAAVPPQPTAAAPSQPTAAMPPLASTGRDTPSLSAGERWRAAVEAVKAASPRHGAALAHGRLLWLRPGEVGVAYIAAAAFHRGQVMGGTGRALVEKALSEHFGRPTKLLVEEATGEVAATLSIAEQEAQARTAHQHTTEGKVRSHPAIRAVLKHLGGEIEHIQVLEPERPAASPTVESPEESA